MDSNKKRFVAEKVILKTSKSVPILKKLKLYNPATKFTSLTKNKMANEVQNSSPNKIPRIINFRTPKIPMDNTKSPVHINLMNRFHHLDEISKENVPQLSNTIINLSDESQFTISIIDDPKMENNRKTTDTLETLARRGISVKPSKMNTVIVENGNFIKLGNDVTISPVNTIIENWFKCSNCSGYFVSSRDLVNHEMEFHQPKANDYGLPVVDLSKAESRDKLISLGINHYMTITNMNQTEGCSSFGIPIVSVQGSANSTLLNIMAMGADGILSLGTFKQIQK